MSTMDLLLITRNEQLRYEFGRVSLLRGPTRMYGSGSFSRHGHNTVNYRGCRNRPSVDAADAAGALAKKLSCLHIFQAVLQVRPPPSSAAQCTPPLSQGAAPTSELVAKYQFLASRETSSLTAEKPSSSQDPPALQSARQPSHVRHV